MDFLQSLEAAYHLSVVCLICAMFAAGFTNTDDDDDDHYGY